MATRPPANLQPPPGVAGWYGCWCQEHGLNPYHPEEWSAVDRAEYAGQARFLFRMRWRRLLEGGDVALIRAQSGRAHLIRMVRIELAEAMAGAPTRSPYALDPCHPHRAGLPRDEKAREKDPIAVIAAARRSRS